MREAGESIRSNDGERRLADAIRDVKNAAADRADVVVDLRDAERMRLELLVTELQQVFGDVPADVDMFDLAISSGLQPRLWIDAVSHVAMGRDKRTYRFVQDRRVGRVVLAESSDMKPIAHQVTRYIAERLVERQRLLDGAVEGDHVVSLSFSETALPGPAERTPHPRQGWSGFLAGLYLVTSGVLLAALAGLVFLLWNRMDELFGQF